jgi:hypothetical protein
VADEDKVREVVPDSSSSPAQTWNEIRERIYVADGWEAPEWRAQWRSATPAEGTAAAAPTR